MKWRFALVLAVVTVTACSPVGAVSTASPSALASSASASSGSASSGFASPDPSLVDIGAGLSGRTGLAATVYVAGPANVAAFAFDATGRLWVATAAYTDSGVDAVYLVPGAGTTPVKIVSGLHTVLGRRPGRGGDGTRRSRPRRGLVHRDDLSDRPGLNRRARPGAPAAT